MTVDRDPMSSVAQEHRVPETVQRVRPAKALPEWITGLLIVALVVPVFIDPGSGSSPLIALFRPFEGSPGAVYIHLGAFVIPVWLGIFFIKNSRAGTRLPRRVGAAHLGWLAAVFTASIAIGVIAGHPIDAVFFYVQTLIPLAAFVLGAHANISIRRLVAVVIGAAAMSTALVLAAVLTSGASSPNEVTRLIVNGIPQYRNFYPTILALGAVLAFNYLHHRPRLYGTALAVFAAALPVLWSRSGLGMIAVGLGASVFLYLRAPLPARYAGRKLALVAGSVAVVLVAAMVLVSSSTVRARIDQAGGLTGASGDQLRAELAATAVGYIVENPLTGRSFLPESANPHDPTDVVAPFRAHNQYLDYALRGGVVAAVLLVAFLVAMFRSNKRLWLRAPDLDSQRLGAAVVSVVLAASFASMFHLLLVQSWTGSLLYFFFGYSTSHVARLTRPAHRVP